MGIRLSLVVAAALGLGIFLPAGIAGADEITVMASPAIREVYLELVPQFERATNHTVATSWVGTADIMKRLKAGERVDLVIIAAASLDELTALGKIVPGSRVDLAKSGVGAPCARARPDPTSAPATR